MVRGVEGRKEALKLKERGSKGQVRRDPERICPTYPTKHTLSFIHKDKKIIIQSQNITHVKHNFPYQANLIQSQNITHTEHNFPQTKNPYPFRSIFFIVKTEAKKKIHLKIISLAINISHSSQFLYICLFLFTETNKRQGNC